MARAAFVLTLLCLTPTLGATRRPPPIAYGVTDDSSKYADDGGTWFYEQLSGASLTENRWSLAWDPSQPTAITELPFLERAAPKAEAAGIRISLALYSSVASQHDPAGFCAWAGKVASTVAPWGIDDFIVWNEPNTRLFWVPQKNAAGKDVAAAAYEQLLATCYDAIKAANPLARVIGMGLSPRASTPASTEPLRFIRDVGRAYRATARSSPAGGKPLMDQLAIHPYPNPSSPTDSPDVGYPNPLRYGIPNLGRVKQAVYDAFNGTAQPTTVSTRKPLTLRIDEVGWQVNTSGLPGYYGVENVKTVSEQQQAAYLKEMIEKYFACDPSVTDVLLFLLQDEPNRSRADSAGQSVRGGGWQSGLLRFGPPGLASKRPAYHVVAQEAAAGRSACRGRLISWKPRRR